MSKHILLLWFVTWVMSGCRLSDRASSASMSKQCQGIARSGKRCSITSTSQLTNDSGRLAADPLRRGGDYCLFHAKPFCTKEIAENADHQLVVILIDLESTGIDISQDRIVELAALHVPADPRFHGSFSGWRCVLYCKLYESGLRGFLFPLKLISAVGFRKELLFVRHLTCVVTVVLLSATRNVRQPAQRSTGGVLGRPYLLSGPCDREGMDGRAREPKWLGQGGGWIAGSVRHDRPAT